MGLAQLFDEGRDVEALDLLQREPAIPCPLEESPGVSVVCRPGVLVADGIGEEGEEPLGGLWAFAGDDGRDGSRREGARSMCGLSATDMPLTPLISRREGSRRS